MYFQLRDFYTDQLDHFAYHAIATADAELCRKLDKLVAKHEKPRSLGKGMTRLKGIYHDEAEAIWSSPVYPLLSFIWRFAHELWYLLKAPLIDKQACIN
jgi:hypothetical protein